MFEIKQVHSITFFTFMFLQHKKRQMSGAVGTAIKTAIGANPIGAALTAASVAGQIFGAVKGGQANNANQRLLNERKSENEAFYNNRVNRDYLETNAAKGMFERLNKNLRNSNKTIDSNAAVTGGTAEASIAAKSKNQENYNDAVSGLAEKATNYQQGQEAMYRGQKSNLDNIQMNINDQKAGNAANLASNASNVASAAANLPGKNAGKDPYGQKIV